MYHTGGGSPTALGSVLMTKLQNLLPALTLTALQYARRGRIRGVVV